MAERLVAELVGTLALVFVGAGSVVVLGAGSHDLVGVALAHGIAMATMVSAVGHVSGGHLNPAVTVGCWIMQRIKAVDALGYVAAQLAGGAAGAALLGVALPDSLTDQVDLGVPAVARGISTGQGVLIEAVLTFFLVWVVFATAIDPEGAFGRVAGLPIGLVVTMDMLMGWPWTGAAMNPARHFGPALVQGSWTTWWVWWVGPLAGGVVAAALYDGILLRRPPPTRAR
jgi:MIP family channel proteins